VDKIRRRSGWRNCCHLLELYPYPEERGASHRQNRETLFDNRKYAAPRGQSNPDGTCPNKEKLQTENSVHIVFTIRIRQSAQLTSRPKSDQRLDPVHIMTLMLHLLFGQFNEELARRRLETEDRVQTTKLDWLPSSHSDDPFVLVVALMAILLPRSRRTMHNCSV
jgi:hypothetical protein